MSKSKIKIKDNKVFERRSTMMTDEEWLALEALASQLESVPTRGPNTDDGSWRTLVREIARGKYILVSAA